MGGILVFEQTFPQLGNSFTINIGNQVPGTYLLTVNAFNTAETYTIIKQ